MKYSTLSFIERSGARADTVGDLQELHEAYEDYREGIGKQDDDFVNKIHVREDQPSSLYILICIYVVGEARLKAKVQYQLDFVIRIYIL